MKFIDFITEKEEVDPDSNGYVALKVDTDSKEVIYNTLSEYINTDRLINDLHMTLMFDLDNPKIKIKPSKEAYNINITDIITLGDVDSEWRSIALKFDSDEIISRFKELVQAGFNHSYDDLMQHISMIYGPTDAEIKLIIANKSKIIKSISSITLNNEYMEPIDNPEEA